MTIGAINSVTQGVGGAQGVNQTNQAAWQQRMEQAMGPVAQLFGESPEQLMQQLQSGSTSLSALAQSKGISQSDLLTAIQKGLQSAGGPASSMSATQLANLSNTIANRVHHGHHHHGGGASTSTTAATSSTTSTDASQATDISQMIAALQNQPTV